MLETQQVALQLLEPLVGRPQIQLNRCQLINYRHGPPILSEIDRFDIRVAAFALLDPDVWPEIGDVILQLVRSSLAAARTCRPREHPLTRAQGAEQEPASLYLRLVHEQTQLRWPAAVRAARLLDIPDVRMPLQRLFRQRLGHRLEERPGEELQRERFALERVGYLVEWLPRKKHLQ